MGRVSAVLVSRLRGGSEPRVRAEHWAPPRNGGATCAGCGAKAAAAAVADGNITHRGCRGATWAGSFELGKPSGEPADAGRGKWRLEIAGGGTASYRTGVCDYDFVRGGPGALCLWRGFARVAEYRGHFHGSRLAAPRVQLARISERGADGPFDGAADFHRIAGAEFDCAPSSPVRV